MSKKSSLNYRGFDFDFQYEYSAGRPATYEDPEEYEEWEIYNITLNGIDADELLDRYMDDFIDEAIENLKNY
jgi:hypothetical protein